MTHVRPCHLSIFRLEAVQRFTLSCSTCREHFRGVTCASQRQPWHLLPEYTEYDCWKNAQETSAGAHQGRLKQSEHPKSRQPASRIHNLRRSSTDHKFDAHRPAQHITALFRYVTTLPTNSLTATQAPTKCCDEAAADVAAAAADVAQLTATIRRMAGVVLAMLLSI